MKNSQYTREFRDSTIQLVLKGDIIIELVEVIAAYNTLGNKAPQFIIEHIKNRVQ